MVTDGPAPTLQFKEDRAGGSTGVNRWSSQYTHVGGDLCFGQVTTTLMAGAEPLMEQEQVFLDVLGRIDGYSIAGSLLELREGDEVLALLEVVPMTIEGTWVLLMLNNGTEGMATLVEGTAITARFEDGAIAGSSGCNRYRAAYGVEGDRIHLGSGMGTRKACTDPHGVMEQEHHFLSLFESAATYEITDGTVLDIYDAERAGLFRFIRPGV
jgi:heat shock protein HslJ